MKIKGFLVGAAVAFALSATPAAAGGTGAMDRCDQNSSAQRTWDLCWWLSLVDLGQPTSWLLWRPWTHR